MNVLVEIKIEYTNQFVNIIAPYIKDGIQSIYNEGVKVSKQGDELKTFQTFLKQIPVWATLTINSEKDRILNESNSRQLLEDLLKAIIKSNIMILTNTPPEKKHELKINFVLDFAEFIHQAYIESARMFYQNPFLYYHKYPPPDITRNQRDALNMIKEAIREAIRKMLPMNLILKEYLGNAYSESSIAKAEKKNVDIERIVTEQDKIRAETLLQKEKDINTHYQLKKDIDSEINPLNNKEVVAASKNLGGGYNDISTLEQDERRTLAEHREAQGNLPCDKDKFVLMADSTGKKIQAYKETMPTHFITKNKQNTNIATTTSESYIPKNDNIVIFETYSNGGNLPINQNAHHSTIKIEKIDKRNKQDKTSKPSKSSNGTENNKKKFQNNEFNI